MIISKEVEALFKEYARSEFPKEACGWVVDGTFYPQPNIAANPLEEFEMAGWPAGNVQAILHSHPNVREAVPSSLDMIHQINTNIPWGIVATDGQWVSRVNWFGDQVPIPDLIGRDFLHGITDCYALVRHWYKTERDIWLKEFPRDDQWWNDPEKPALLTPENFQSAGFREIDYTEMKVGSVILGTVLGNKVNHSAVFVGNGLIMHHLYNRKSRREPLGPWLKHCKYFLEYAG